MTQRQRRKLWAEVHRYLGLGSVLFLAIAAVTGCLLAYDKPIDAALNADLFKRAHADTAVDPVAAVIRFQASHPELQVTSFPLHAPADRNIAIKVAPAPGAARPDFDQVFLDGGDGHAIGSRSTEPSWGRRGLMAGVLEFHANLLAGAWGRWLMGVMALAWLVSAISGAYLTFPRKPPFWRKWTRAWRFSFRRMFARLMLDIHRASGLWLLIGVVMLAFTSVCLNFFSEIYQPMVVRIAPPKPSLFDRPAPFPQGARPRLSYADAIHRIEMHARNAGQSWRPATALYIPRLNLYGVTFTNDGTLNYRALGPVYYYVDAKHGRVVEEDDPYSDSAGLVMIRMLYPLHSGQVAGPITVFFVFLFGLSTFEMCATGFYLWWKNRRSRLAARERREARARCAV